MGSSSQVQRYPRVGVGVLVFKENQILLGERRNSHGAGTWCPPGGHLEFGESPQDCAVRELEEETGLIAEEVVRGPWTNDVFEQEDKHYVTLFMTVTHFTGVPSLMEPEKCLGWEWFDLDDLPSPLFIPFSNLIKAYPLRHPLTFIAE